MTSFYVDASALVKLVLPEPQSEPLRRTLEGQDVAASELLLTEVPRAVHRLPGGLPAESRSRLFDRASTVLSRTTLLPLDRTTLELAGRFEERFLRALDAIHLATAVIAGDDVQAFVTYDRRQAEAASMAGFEVLAPGT